MYKAKELGKKKSMAKEIISRRYLNAGCFRKTSWRQTFSGFKLKKKKILAQN